MRGQPGVMDRIDPALPAEILSHPRRAWGVSADAIGNRLQAAQREPAFERRWHRSAFALDAADPLEQRSRLFEDQRTPEHIAVSGEILRHRVHYHVGAKLQ